MDFENPEKKVEKKTLELGRMVSFEGRVRLNEDDNYAKVHKFFGVELKNKQEGDSLKIEVQEASSEAELKSGPSRKYILEIVKAGTWDKNRVTDTAPDSVEATELLRNQTLLADGLEILTEQDDGRHTKLLVTSKRLSEIVRLVGENTDLIHRAKEIIFAERKKEAA